ncbi:hypothetical protein JYT22_01095, partial [Endomicrobium sp. AH-315-J14]|nr:hypothetical protein [Endomicrobium sp. AH-315-J14]
MVFRKLTLSLVAGLVVGLVSNANAGDPPDVRASCELSGTVPARAGTPIYDDAKGGEIIATFTGAEVPLIVSHFPADTSKGRVHVKTSGGNGHMAVRGWTAANAVMYYGAREVSVGGGTNVWISSSQELQIVGAKGGEFFVAHKVMGSSKVVRGTVPCDGVVLVPPRIEPTEVPPRARGYKMKKSILELYNRPRGELIYTMRPSPGAQPTFWSTESRAGYVHLVTATDLTIDGWASWREVTLMRRSEFVPPQVPAPRRLDAKKLGIPEPPPIATATERAFIYSTT